MEFQVQSVYLIYTGLMVHATLNLAYSKKHMLFIRLTYNKYIIILKLSSFFYVTVTVTYDGYVTQCHRVFVTVTCNIILISNFKFKIK